MKTYRIYYFDITKTERHLDLDSFDVINLCSYIERVFLEQEAQTIFKIELI